ncbi:MAG: hypothetical protein ASARMPRED_002448 [Alectoria sarmentosa]|nr:MAG: hypothetical protein ASARMPRED_002448 [Alectoria sarmentosa]
MSSIKPTPRVRPAAPAPPNSPRTEEHQGDCVYYSFPEWPSGASINVKVEGRSQSPEQGVGRALPSFNPNQHPNLIQPSPFTHHHHHGYHPDAFAKHAEHDGPDDIDADGHSLHVGLQIGRLGITEKINGFLRPDVASQIATLLSQTEHVVSPYSRQMTYGTPTTQHPARPATQPNCSLVKRILPLEPSPGLLTTVSPSFLPQLGPEFPTFDELHLLYSQYWSAVDPLAHIIHRPSFEGECRQYMPRSQVIDAAPASFKALLLAMCLAAAVSLPLMRTEEMLGVRQQTLVDRLKIGTEKALIDANFMSSVTIQTLQAFTIYLIPQCRTEISRSHTVYVGALIRLAMGAGLNRDASDPKMDPVDCQVRRLLWHQICFLDLLTAEGQGLQPVIRDDEFDTRLPRNINDDAFDRPDNKSVPASGWTDATFSIIRYECCMVHRLISRQRLATDNGQTDLRDLKTVQHLVSVQKLRIEHQYLQYLDEAIPIQRCAKLIGRLFTTRFDAILFHKYSQFDVNTELQTDLRETLIESCLTVCECAVALDTDPELAPWAWYARANHQYERSIFLLMDVHRDPYSPHAIRINRILDHVFGTYPNMGSRDRSRKLLQILAEEFNKMTQMRKVKTSQSMTSENGSSSPNDLSGMVSTPEDGQQWSHWQPEVNYSQGYNHDLPPVNGSAWWPMPIPIQPGMLCDPSGSQHDEYTDPQHDEYGYGMGPGHG